MANVLRPWGPPILDETEVQTRDRYLGVRKSVTMARVSRFDPGSPQQVGLKCNAQQRYDQVSGWLKQFGVTDEVILIKSWDDQATTLPFTSLVEVVKRPTGQ